jgi:hypothetical protein
MHKPMTSQFASWRGRFLLLSNPFATRLDAAAFLLKACVLSTSLLFVFDVPMQAYQQTWILTIIAVTLA